MSARLDIRKEDGRKALAVKVHGIPGTVEHDAAVLARDFLSDPGSIDRAVVARRVGVLRRFQKAMLLIEGDPDNEVLAEWCKELEAMLALAGVEVIVH